LLEQSSEQAIPEQIIQVAIEHRLMHGETLAYLLHNLPYDQKASGATPLNYSSRALAAAPMIEIAPGLATLGQKHGKFGWDNEFPRCIAEVPRFTIANYPVTNAAWLRFVEEGGQVPEFWVQREVRLVFIVFRTAWRRLGGFLRLFVIGNGIAESDADFRLVRDQG